MEIRRLHPWDVSYQEAIEIQKNLQSKRVIKKLPRKITHVAGTDVSFSKGSDSIWAGVVVFKYPDLIKTEERWAKGTLSFPYIPGLLSFREIPVLLRALRRLKTDLDLIFCDGQGIAHPRGLGIASHLGLLLDKPTIGCAKTRLVGEFSEVGEEKGRFTHLWYNGHVVGEVVRTRRGVKPLFVSPGHKITIEESVNMVLGCCLKYRLPEPTRQAHLLVSRLRRGQEAV